MKKNKKLNLKNFFMKSLNLRLKKIREDISNKILFLNFIKNYKKFKKLFFKYLKQTKNIKYKYFKFFTKIFKFFYDAYFLGFIKTYFENIFENLDKYYTSNIKDYNKKSYLNIDVSKGLIYNFKKNIYLFVYFFLENFLNYYDDYNMNIKYIKNIQNNNFSLNLNNLNNIKNQFDANTKSDILSTKKSLNVFNTPSNLYLNISNILLNIKEKYINKILKKLEKKNIYICSFPSIYHNTLKNLINTNISDFDYQQTKYNPSYDNGNGKKIYTLTVKENDLLLNKKFKNKGKIDNLNELYLPIDFYNFFDKEKKKNVECCTLLTRENINQENHYKAKILEEDDDNVYVKDNISKNLKFVCFFDKKQNNVLFPLTIAYNIIDNFSIINNDNDTGKDNSKKMIHNVFYTPSLIFHGDNYLYNSYLCSYNFFDVFGNFQNIKYFFEKQYRLIHFGLKISIVEKLYNLNKIILGLYKTIFEFEQQKKELLKTNLNSNSENTEITLKLSNFISKVVAILNRVLIFLENYYLANNMLMINTNKNIDINYFIDTSNLINNINDDANNYDDVVDNIYNTVILDYKILVEIFSQVKKLLIQNSENIFTISTVETEENNDFLNKLNNQEEKAQKAQITDKIISIISDSMNDIISIYTDLYLCCSKKNRLFLRNLYLIEFCKYIYNYILFYILFEYIYYVDVNISINRNKGKLNKFSKKIYTTVNNFFTSYLQIIENIKTSNYIKKSFLKYLNKKIGNKDNLIGDFSTICKYNIIDFETKTYNLQKETAENLINLYKDVFANIELYSDSEDIEYKLKSKNEFFKNSEQINKKQKLKRKLKSDSAINYDNINEKIKDKIKKENIH